MGQLSEYLRAVPLVDLGGGAAVGDRDSAVRGLEMLAFDSLSAGTQ